MSTADAAAPLGPDTHQGRDHTHVEQWLPVVGFESLYEVSDLGRVRSLDRVDTLGRLRRGRIMTGTIDGEGYRSYGLTPKDPDGMTLRTKMWLGHALVLTAFVGPRPAGMEACHANDVPDDNRLQNLRWDTPEANRADKARLATGLTSRHRRRVRKPHPRPKCAVGRCMRGHRLVAPNLTAPQTSHPNGRCRACSCAHAVVRKYRLRGVELDLAAAADLQYRLLMGALGVFERGL